jgi:hypothetical protein
MSEQISGTDTAWEHQVIPGAEAEAGAEEGVVERETKPGCR